MSTKEWNQMLQLAKQQQQEYYELLPEWTAYKKDEYKYLKQNIGFALFGPPTKSNIKLDKDKAHTDNDIINAFHYKDKAQKVIDTIYDQVLAHGDGSVKKQHIYYGIIFNVTIHKSISECDKEQNKKESKKIEINLYTAPIFKILKSENIVWYIDIDGRIYKSWMDYKKNNTLPKCTMVLPMNGCYRPDCSFMVTEESSLVWLEILKSPACSATSTALNTADTATSVVGIIGLCLSVATFFTPAAPVAIGALATTGLSGVWATGRAAHNLVDRYKHEESINVTNRNAFCSWLTITGSTVGLAATGANVALSRFIQQGNIATKAHRMTYNALLLSNLTVNGLGMVWQGYCMYEKYQEGKDIEIIDIISFGAHLLFFGNAVVNLQFAGDLINQTQGRVVDEYRSSIRSKNLRKKFNRTKRTAAANNADKMSENAEVIRYINRKMELRMANNKSNMNLNDNATGSNLILLDNGMMKICGYSLLDPLKFVALLINLDQNSTSAGYSSGPSTSEDTNRARDMVSRLKDLLSELLSDFSRRYKTPHVLEVDAFSGTFEDMKYMENGLLIMKLIFKIATALVNKRPELIRYIVNAVHFVWCYIKESVRANALTAIFSVDNETIQRALMKILQSIYDRLDTFEQRLLPAFEKYISEYIDRLFFSHSGVS